jgi:hypothetical protein
MTNNFDKTAQNNSTTGSLKIVILPKDNGLYTCQLSSEIDFSKTNLHRDFPKGDILCDGQTPEHALAIGLEQLAANCRQLAEDSQNIDWLTVEKTPSGKVIEKTFHVTIHYECIIDDESKFEAFHNTQSGNLVVENARITGIVIDPLLHIEQAQRLIREEDEDDDDEEI